MANKLNSILPHLYFRMWQRTCGWLSDRKNLFFLVLIIVHLIPIWSFKYFPSTDGPSHINNANVIREYYHPDRTVFREYYTLNNKLEPTWFLHLILAGLMYLASAAIAEKILLTAYVILLPFSIRYALRAIRPGAEFLSILAFPFIYNYLLHMGFYSFSYSLPMFFFTVGYWLKYHGRLTFRKALTLASLSLGLYFCHMVSLFMAYVAIALLTIWLTVFELSSPIPRSGKSLQLYWKAFQKRAFIPLCSFLPTLILVAIFLIDKQTTTLAAPGLLSLMKSLFKLSSLISYEESEIWLSTPLLALFVSASFYILVLRVASRQVKVGDGFFLVVLAYILIYFVAPDTYLISHNQMTGGGYVKHRLNLYPFFALILWFATQTYRLNMKRTIQLVSAAVALMLLGHHVVKYSELNDYLDEYLSGMHLIQMNTTLLPLSFSNHGHTADEHALSFRISPFAHAAGHIAVRRRIVEFTNYEANTGYFPTIFRPNLNPYIHIGEAWKLENLEYQSSRVDFLTYPHRTGGRVDYVLVWGLRKKQIDHDHIKSIFRQLQLGYYLIYTSPQRGLMQLYRRKDYLSKAPID